MYSDSLGVQPLVWINDIKGYLENTGGLNINLRYRIPHDYSSAAVVLNKKNSSQVPSAWRLGVGWRGNII